MSSEPLPFQPNPGTPTIGTCTICHAQVTAHAKKANPNEYYLKNLDGSYHRVFGKDYGTSICVKTKEEAEWQSTYKDNLAQFMTGQGPPPTSVPSAPGQPTRTTHAPMALMPDFNGALTALDVEGTENCIRFHTIMMPKALNLALQHNPVDEKDRRIIACGFMHDFATIWGYTMLVVEKRGTFQKAASPGREMTAASQADD